MTSQTKSPTQNQPVSPFAQWNNPDNAHADGGGEAASTGLLGNYNVWKGYGFNIPEGAADIKVHVKPDHKEDAYEMCQCRVSWDAGTSWSPYQFLPSRPSFQTDTLDFTAATNWTPSKLSDANFRVEYDLPPAGCFALDTEVSLWPSDDDLSKPPQMKKIQDIRVGEEIIGWDIQERGFCRSTVTELKEHTGTFSILQIICRIPESLYEYARERCPEKVQHGPFKDVAVTNDHPVSTVTRGTVRAEQIVLGDLMWGCFGQKHKIQPVEVCEIRKWKTSKVYDLQCTSRYFFKHYSMLVEMK